MSADFCHECATQVAHCLYLFDISVGDDDIRFIALTKPALKAKNDVHHVQAVRSQVVSQVSVQGEACRVNVPEYAHDNVVEKVYGLLNTYHTALLCCGFLRNASQDERIVK